MDVRELMIGDIVYNTYRNKNIRWDYTEMFYHGRPIEGRDIEPVPLTREILELNGFKMRERFQYSEDEWIESFVNLECTFKVLFSDKDGFLWNGRVNYTQRPFKKFIVRMLFKKMEYKED